MSVEFIECFFFEMHFLQMIIIILSTVYRTYSYKNEIIISNCTRVIDLKSQLVTIKYHLALHNNDTNIIEKLYWSINENGKLVYFKVVDSLGKQLETKKSKKSRSYIIYLWIYMLRNSNERLTIVEVYARGIKPLPAEIKQNQQQFFIYVGNVYINTRYYVKEQRTSVLLSNDNVESYTIRNPTETRGKKILYGPYRDIPAKTNQTLKIHYNNNGRFLTVREIKRKIIISHWGFIQVEEEIKLMHTGAKIEGPFSRYDFDHVSNSSENRITYIETNLPASAVDIYHRDDIGYIFSCDIRKKRSYVKVKFRPRFPLVGGWQTMYIIGYKLPIHEYLLYDRDKYKFIFNIRFIGHIFDEMYVEKAETSVVLPVYSKLASVDLPFDARNMSNCFMHNYLDYQPRLVLKYIKYDLIEKHMEEMQIGYQWSNLVFFYQPMLFVSILYLLFASVIFYVRLDFSIAAKN